MNNGSHTGSASPTAVCMTLSTKDSNMPQVKSWLISIPMTNITTTRSFPAAAIFSTMEDVDWLLGRASFYNDEGTIVDVKDLKKWCKLNYYLGEYQWIQQESVFWRRNLWLKAGSKINTELKYAGDYELWLRFFRFAKLYSVETVFAGFRFRSKDQLSLDKMDSYLYEVDMVTNLSGLPREDKYAIKKMKFIRNFILKIPLIRRFKFIRRNIERTFDYPPKICYDFGSRKFFKNYSPL
jgi:hypothetical protein